MTFSPLFCTRIFVKIISCFHVDKNVFETISLIDVIWLNQDFDFGFSGKSQVSGFIRKLKNIPGCPAYFVQRVKLDCSGFSIFQN